MNTNQDTTTELEIEIDTTDLQVEKKEAHRLRSGVRAGSIWECSHYEYVGTGRR